MHTREVHGNSLPMQVHHHSKNPAEPELGGSLWLRVSQLSSKRHGGAGKGEGKGDMPRGVDKENPARNPPTVAPAP